MAVLPDLSVAAIVAVVAYFMILGVLIVFAERTDTRTFVGVFLVLVGLAIGLVALGEAGLGTLVAAILAALATDQSIEFLGAP